MSDAIDILLALHDRTLMEAEQCALRGQMSEAKGLWRLCNVLSTCIPLLALHGQEQELKFHLRERPTQ